MGSYLITGGTGNVGRALAAQLAAAGHTVRIATRNPGQAALPAGARAIAFDYGRRATWAPALDGMEGAFFLNVGAPPEVVGECMAAAHKAGVQRGVGMTALGVEFLPVNTPPRVFESALIDSGLAWTILRPTWFMQNFSSGFAAPMVRQGVLRLPAEEGRTAFVDTRDIAAVAATALTQQGHASQAYGLTGGEALTYGEVAAIVSTELGRSVRYEHVETEAFLQAMDRLGFSPDAAGLIAALYASVRSGEAAQVLPTVEQVTGRAPTSFAQFVRDTLAPAQ